MKDDAEKELERMQQGFSELFERRRQALEKVCPACWGNLVAQDICSVFCPDCSIQYSVEEILKGAT